MQPSAPIEVDLDTLDPIQGSIQGILDLLTYLSASQRAYLLARPVTAGRTKAAAIAGVNENTVYTWRSVIPGFREAEAAIMDAKGDAALQLSRALAKGAMPSITQRQITQALEDHKALVGQQLMAQQRAREHVSRLSGIEDAPTGRDPVVSLLGELYALAQLHAQRQQSPASLPSPTQQVIDLLPSVTTKPTDADKQPREG